VVFVSHDRYFLDRIADGIVEVRDGELYRHEGGYSVRKNGPDEGSFLPSVAVDEAR
jgi:ATPase subunit of ABC transporter with duplicated ATPase domains